MKTTRFDPNENKLHTPAQVMADFNNRYSQEEAQRKLWKLILPALLESLQEQDAVQANSIVAFYEHLELLLKAVYHTSAAVEETTTGSRQRISHG